jgi:3-deoxy-7-phosphoheptulonate synthase
MLVVMQQGATEPQIQKVIDRLVEQGFDVHRSTGVMHTVLGGVGGKTDTDLEIYEVMEGVKEAHRIASPYKLASRNFKPGGTVVKVGGVAIGGQRVVVMAGPCSVESLEQIECVAEQVARAGARVIRGGAFKPRSSPYSFQGLGGEGLQMLRAAADRNGLLVVSEVMDQTQIPLWPNIPIFCKSARAICRTTICCGSWASSGSRCC